MLLFFAISMAFLSFVVRKSILIFLFLKWTPLLFSKYPGCNTFNLTKFLNFAILTTFTINPSNPNSKMSEIFNLLIIFSGYKEKFPPFLI